MKSGSGFATLFVCWCFVMLSGATGLGSDSLINIELIDPMTGKSVPGVIRLTNDAKEIIRPPELRSRAQFLFDKKEFSKAYPYDHMTQWYILDEGKKITVPSGALTIEAIQGIGSQKTTCRFESITESERYIIPVSFIEQKTRANYIHGNVHLHYKRIAQEDGLRYTQEVTPVDGLKVICFSYLERPTSDSSYVSNHYDERVLAGVTEKNGVHYALGEEYRHNYGTHGEGYGHVILLNDRKTPITRPASFGRGLMNARHDHGTIFEALISAKQKEMTRLWCHNGWGLEAIPNIILGQLHGMIIFDQGYEESYDDTFYKLYNVGCQFAMTCGTDWFLRDMSATYCNLENNSFTVKDWLRAIEQGKTYISNGTLLSFTINDNDIGTTLSFFPSSNPRLRVKSHAIGRNDFVAIELVCNGKVIDKADSTLNRNQLFEATIDKTISCTQSSWYAVRVIPSVDSYEHPQCVPNGKGYNEFYKPLFAHTSPIYVNIRGTTLFDSASAQILIERMESAKDKINTTSTFLNEHERQRVISVYDEAIEQLSKN